MNWAGSNNINAGVTIDLGFLNSTRYDPDTQTSRLGPGAKWKDVYAELGNHGRTVVGAREAECGVGGFLLGGGNTFHTPSHGFACDNVVAYEVVLADGRIITADAEGEHIDLFRCLKGGGNNFGIVTSFQMRTIPSGPIWGGLALRSLDVVQAAVDALVDFTANSTKDPDSNLQLVVGHQPRFGGSVAITLCNNMAAVENPPILQRTLALPEISNNFKTTTLEEILTYTSLPRNFHNVWFTLTFKNDSSIINKAAELHNQLAKELQEKIPDGDFTSHVAFQPIPRLFVERSLAVNPSGNVLGLEQNKHDAILIQASASVRTPELEEWVRPKVRAVVEGVRAFAATIDGGAIPWIYLNYAHSSQDVLQSYGPENLRLIRETAHRYDSEGVFQHLCPGGFKLPLVGQTETVPDLARQAPSI
ncbi:putative fad binding domain containing protein [Diaporthe ampelina]|uniref:Putative fad binding domain containing protein n=1 Tax=Diaporthe ampelina TaxID=1214573 RepID=A0A0G2FL25_9PEZI|nr:putative fad binding domain containing protein [Diaporthe ampelina]